MAGIGNIFVAPHRRFIRLHIYDCTLQMQRTNRRTNGCLACATLYGIWINAFTLYAVWCRRPTIKLFVRTTRFNAVRALSVRIDEYMVMDMGMDGQSGFRDLKEIGRESRDANTWSEHELGMENGSYTPRSTKLYQNYIQEVLLHLFPMVCLVGNVEPEIKFAKWQSQNRFQILSPKYVSSLKFGELIFCI